MGSQIQSQVDGCLLMILSHEEVTKLKGETHNLAPLNMAYNPGSKSTPIRLIIDTSHPFNSNPRATLSNEIKTPKRVMSSMLVSMLAWRLSHLTKVFDIAKC